MVLFYKAITYILKSSYRAKEGLSVGLIHRPALLASQIYRLCALVEGQKGLEIIL